MTFRSYLSACTEIYHTTLNPRTPGVVRIHLIPPKKLKPGIPWLVILNGYSILPLQTSWAILLKEFIHYLNESQGRSLTGEQIAEIKDKTAVKMKELFPKVEKEDICKDLDDIISTLISVACGEEPEEEIGYMTLAKYAKNMKAPHRMDLMISAMEKNNDWNCNQKCLHCYACGEKMASVEELPTEDWKRILDICKKACIPAITFTGGEPTLRQDLVELVSYASWFITRLNTNGLLLTKSLCCDLYQASLDSVQITLYSFDEKIHNSLVGGNHFQQTIAGIKNAVEAKLNVSINTPLCSMNKDYSQTIAFAKDLGVQFFSCSGLISTGNAKSEDSKMVALSKTELLTVLKSAYGYTKKNDLELSFTSPGWIEESELKKMKMVVPSCGACLSNMAIAPNGIVLPCQSWLSEDGLGPILTKKWKDIWNDKRCKVQRCISSKQEQTCPLRKEV